MGERADHVAQAPGAALRVTWPVAKSVVFRCCYQEVSPSTRPPVETESPMALATHQCINDS